MSKSRRHIKVFEHETLRMGEIKDDVEFDEPTLQSLQRHFGSSGVPYFSLVHNGVRFNEYVGVLQVGNTLIEVLPKADKVRHTESEEKKWRNILIGMLKAIGNFNVKVSGASDLRLKANTILDLYIELFVSEVEYLLHSGLVKKYRKVEGNRMALKGSLQFAQHIQQNLTHQERFYVRHTAYDKEHLLHIILYKTINLLKDINKNGTLHGRIGALQLNFPDMPDVKVSDGTFDRIIFDRKSLPYKKAIEIARLLLLRYHPDVRSGANHVLALMFDMNSLWEKFVLVSLSKHLRGEASVTGQTSKYFWKPQGGYRSTIRPDILITSNSLGTAVLDTKWKNLGGNNPSSEDLRQMYVYHEYYGAKKVALIYPGNKDEPIRGNYIDPMEQFALDKECSIIGIKPEDNVLTWQEQITESIKEWIKEPAKV